MALRQQVLRCWCVQGVCHRCNRAAGMLSVCAGCEHHFCSCCAHRLDEKYVCVSCLAVWIGITTSLGMPPVVKRWFDEVRM
jgi:hypothetical protein